MNAEPVERRTVKIFGLARVFGSEVRFPARPIRSLRQLANDLGSLRAELNGLSAEVGELRSSLSSLPQWGNDRDRVLEILRLIYYDEPRLRERLHEARASETYELPYAETEPLVSVLMRTYDNYQLLADRSIPSVLNQSYQRFEIIVIGDHAPAEAEMVVQGFKDDRIIYYNLNRRGPYPSEPRAFWNVAGVPPYNEGLRRARGRWIAPLDDDDVFRPDHIEALLGIARRDHLELAYGKLLIHSKSGPSTTVGVFPPEHGEFGFQGAIVHSGLRFFELELAEALFSLPDDWGAAERMLRAGVRVGMLDHIVTEYFPSAEFTPRGQVATPNGALGTRAPSGPPT